MKRICLFFALLIPLISFAAEYRGTTGECTWSLDTKLGILTISGTGSMDNYGSLKEQPWYDYRFSVKSIKVENGVKKIGNYAFCGLSKATTAELGSNVVSIGKSAFEKCISLSSVNIPAKVTNILSRSFFGCSSISYITIPKNVKAIGGSAFYECI